MAKAGALALIVSIALAASAANAGLIVAVPELDSSSASMGIALLASGLLLLGGRRPKR